MLRSTVLFVFMGVLEISGVYLIWLWLRNDKPLYFGLAGAFFLLSYGIVATIEYKAFSQVFATYGGFFILLSLLWGYHFENYRPKLTELIGAAIVIIGVIIMITASDSSS